MHTLTCAYCMCVCVFVKTWASFFPLAYESEIFVLRSKLAQANGQLEIYKRISHAKTVEIERIKKEEEEKTVAPPTGMWKSCTH